jgi:GAF domain-containing protein
VDKLGAHIALDRHPSIVAYALRSREVYLSEDVLNDPNNYHVAWLPETRSELVLPLQAQQEFIGLLDLQSEQVRFQRMMFRFRVMANQIALLCAMASIQQVVRFNEQPNPNDEMPPTLSRMVRSTTRHRWLFTFIDEEYAAALNPRHGVF